MRVGVGLPTTVPGCDSALVLDWARRAEEAGFASLAVLDRVRYVSYDPLLALAFAAGATTRVSLVTNILISPLRSLALLAKESASLQAISSGRFILGVAVGAREEDYRIAGVPYGRRGRLLDEQVATLPDLWEEGALTPPLVDGGEGSGDGAGANSRGALPPPPPILVGGLTDAAFARVARFASGYMHNGGPPRAFSRMADRVRAAWYDAGRPEQPRLFAQGYFALGGAEARAAGEAYLRDYYAFTGPFVERIVSELLTTPQQVRQFLRGYADAGCDEMLLYPTVGSLDQLDLLAEVCGGRA